MKIVIAPDSYKGSLSATEASKAIERGVRKALPDAETVLVPAADGGEGTMDSLVAATNGQKVEVTVKGPLLEDVQAAYAILGDQKTCVIEMASASGLCLVDPAELNPLITTSYGTGELIQKALNDGCRKFILAIGGSATNDGGVGMLQALGMKVFDEEGKTLGYGGAELSRISNINTEDFDSRIADSEFLIASDVQNPLVGPDGASRVFGPQKGRLLTWLKCLIKLYHHGLIWLKSKQAYTCMIKQVLVLQEELEVHFKPFSVQKQKGASILSWSIRNWVKNCPVPIVSLPVRAKSITRLLQAKHPWELHKKPKSMVFRYLFWLDRSEQVLKFYMTTE